MIIVIVFWFCINIYQGFHLSTKHQCCAFYFDFHSSVELTGIRWMELVKTR